MSSFECKNSFFNITSENNSFSITIPGHWQNKSDEKTIDALNKLLEPRSLGLQVKQVRKRGNKTKIRDSEYKLSDFDTQKKNEILEELKNAKYKDIEDSVYRMQLTFDEVIKILGKNIFLQKERGLFFKSRYLWSSWFKQHLKIYFTRQCESVYYNWWN